MWLTLYINNLYIRLLNPTLFMIFLPLWFCGKPTLGRFRLYQTICSTSSAN